MGHSSTPPPAERLAEIELVTDRARAGDQTAVPRLRELLRDHPELVSHYGDLGSQALTIWVALIAGTDLYLKEALAVRLADLRRDLVGEEPGPVMALLADRVVTSWLVVSHATAVAGSALLQNQTSRVVTFWGKRRLEAERGHLTALAALATMRRLGPEPAPARSPTGVRAAIPAAAGPGELANRVSAYFADLPLAGASAARPGPPAAVK